MKKTAKGIGWYALAFITCPCHLIIILPLLAGTALGSYLAAYQTVNWVVLGIAFVFSFYMGWGKMNQDDKSESNVNG
jgi:mercuric ion transport protein